MDPVREPLSARERQIMDVVFAHSQATVADVRAAIPDPPSYSAVRATMGVLVEKGWLDHSKEGRQYVYHPTVSPRSARRSALRHVVETFFGGSAESAVATLLDTRSARLNDDELKRIEDLVRKAREARS